MNILVIDDHPLIVEGMGSALRELGNEIKILPAENTETALHHLQQAEDLQLVVLDWKPAGEEGATLIKKIRGYVPDVPIVVLSAHDTRDAVIAALEAGARGFISKLSPNRVLLRAIKLVLSGGIYIPPQILSGTGSQNERAEKLATTRIRPLGLTERQTEVLALLVEGKPNKLICRELNVSEGTVKTHVSAILRALNVSNRAQVSYAINRLGLPMPMRGIKPLGPV